MNDNEMQELIINHFYNSEQVNTEALLQKIRPVVLHKCEEIKKQQNNITQTVIFIISCVLVMFIGVLILFPDYIDYSSELIEFVGVGLTIGIFCTLVFLVFRAIITSTLNNKEMKFRERMILND